ncbi:uncharacterized protein LOC122818766 [Drosophila biarmipes]|uniref:uncharacterized protein LOC122818766 n=1 Tax=Drosophila biarmipes TaxID=125945 RepID=UPI001CDAD5AC|nr:uncharacterized protein LOC122818766 [Drosophila biarmipes]
MPFTCIIDHASLKWLMTMKALSGRLASPKTKKPLQKLYIDFLGKYPRSKSGHACIIIVVDNFPKYTFLKAMMEATGTNVVSFLVSEVFYKFGVSEAIHLDNGKLFVSKAFEEMIDGFGIEHLNTPVYSP